MIHLGPLVIGTLRELDELIDAAIQAHDALTKDRRVEQQKAVIDAQHARLKELARQVELLTQAACMDTVNEADRARRLP